jgi:hypothetical protein
MPAQLLSKFENTMSTAAQSLPTSWSEYTELPLHLSLPVPIYLGLCLAYATLYRFFKTDRERAYILSTISAITVSTASLPFFYLYLTSGFGGVHAASQQGTMATFTEVTVTFFGVYLFGECLSEVE